MNSPLLTTATIICLGICAGAVAVLRVVEWANQQAKTR